VDSGATDSFLTPLLVKWMGLQIYKIRIPKPILTVNGSEHKQGKLIEYMDLVLRLGEQWRKQRFYIATLGYDRAILGFPFLNKFNPNINWAKNEIVGYKGVQIEPEQEPQEDLLIWILQLQNEARKQCGEPEDEEELVAANGVIKECECMGMHVRMQPVWGCRQWTQYTYGWAQTVYINHLCEDADNGLQHGVSTGAVGIGITKLTSVHAQMGTNWGSVGV
jgi:hypothetical protein